MAITYTEEVTVPQLQNVRVCQIGILILLVRIMTSDTTLCRK